MNGVRAIIAMAFFAAGVQRWCIEPVRFEFTIERLERATRRSAALSEEDGRRLARLTADTVRTVQDRFEDDVRLAMIEGANDRILRRSKEAVHAYERALGYDRRPEIYLNLAMALADAGDRNGAVGKLAVALRFAPNLAADIEDIDLRQRAIASIRNGRTSPYCCAFRSGPGLPVRVISTVHGAPITEPGGASIRIPRDSTAEFAWNDGDGRPHIVVQKAAGGSVARLQFAVGSERETASPMPFTEEGWRVVGYGPFLDGDAPAFLLVHPRTYRVRLLAAQRSGGAADEASAPLLVQANASIAACADFDHDGAVDAVYRSDEGEESIVLLQQTRAVSKAILPSAGFQRELVAAADFDGDSNVDLLWYDLETKRLLLWVMDGIVVRRVRYWPTP